MHTGAEDIMAALQAGNARALEDLYATHREGFFRWAGRRFQVTRQDMEDAWQEAVIAFYEQVRAKKLTSLRTSPRVWLFAVGYRQLAKGYKKTGRFVWKDAIDDFLRQEAWSDDTDEPQAPEWAFIEQCLQTISPQCQEILIQRFFEEKKIPEIRALLGHSSENTTSATLSRCLKKLKENVMKKINQRL